MASETTVRVKTPLPTQLHQSELEPGALVGVNLGGYEIEAWIGEGPTGTLYRAEDLIGNKVAVKVLNREFSRPELVTRLAEVQNKVRALNHERIAQIFDSGWTEDGQHFFVSDYLSGSDLADVMRDGPMPLGRAIGIARQVASALSAAHATGVTHANLKPRNIYLAAAEGENNDDRPMKANSALSVKVLDFGTVKLYGLDCPLLNPSSSVGMLFGNPFYMAPEQFGGATDPRSDLYTLAVILFEMLTGNLPFNGPSYGQVMMKHLTDPVPSPRSFRPDIPQALETTLMRALEKDPNRRHVDVEAFVSELETSYATRRPTLMMQTPAAPPPAPLIVEARTPARSTLQLPAMVQPVPVLREDSVVEAIEPDAILEPSLVTAMPVDPSAVEPVLAPVQEDLFDSVLAGIQNQVSFEKVLTGEFAKPVIDVVDFTPDLTPPPSMAISQIRDVTSMIPRPVPQQSGLRVAMWTGGCIAVAALGFLGGTLYFGLGGNNGNPAATAAIAPAALPAAAVVAAPAVKVEPLVAPATPVVTAVRPAAPAVVPVAAPAVAGAPVVAPAAPAVADPSTEQAAAVPAAANPEAAPATPAPAAAPVAAAPVAAAPAAPAAPVAVAPAPVAAAPAVAPVVNRKPARAVVSARRARPAKVVAEAKAEPAAKAGKVAKSLSKSDADLLDAAAPAKAAAKPAAPAAAPAPAKKAVKDGEWVNPFE